jgi:putative ABC transport system substrate-binding protein
MQPFAKELVTLQPDVILASTTPTTAALLQQTRTIPVVFATVGDPIGSGFVASLPRPGGNVTGFTTIEGSLGGKWLELLKEIAPRVNRVVFLLNPVTATYAETYLSPSKRPQRDSPWRRLLHPCMTGLSSNLSSPRRLASRIPA